MDIGTITRVTSNEENDRLVAADPAKLKKAIAQLRAVSRANATVVKRLVESAALVRASKQDKDDAVRLADLFARMTANTLADPDLTDAARLRRAAGLINNICDIADDLMGQTPIVPSRG